MSEPLTIERLAYGAHGVTRADGKVLFVRHVAPGDIVEVRIDEDHGTYAYATATRLLQASSQGCQPPCPYLPACGGCQWQHVNYEGQLAAKESNVADHLRRIARIESPPLLPILRSPLEFGYRSRVTLRCDQGRIGFLAAASHDIVEVDHCLLGDDSLNEAWSEVADLVRSLRSTVHRAEMIRHAPPHGQRVVLWAEIEGDLAAADESTILSFLRDSPRVCGVALHGRRWRRVWGEGQISISPEEGLTLHAEIGAFTQVNPLANRLLVEQVLQLGVFTAEDRVLDVYSGIGNLTFPIARRTARVTAIEQDRLGALAAENNARALGIRNVKVIRAAARTALAQWRQQGLRVDVVVVDPPRSGIADIAKVLLELAAPRLVYVSCNPSTLARDLKALSSRYRVEAVQPLDMFPHTYHVEVIVRATLV